MICLRRQALLVALLACFTQVLSQQVMNLDFRYDFFENEDPQRDPTDGELSALMCATQRFLSQVVQQSTNNTAVTMEAKDIGYTRGTGVNGTEFHVTFWGNFSSADGTPLPPDSAILEAFKITNPVFNATSYIVNYVMPSTPLDESGSRYFRTVNEMSYNGTYGGIRSDGVALAEPVCEITLAPTYAPTPMGKSFLL